MVRSRMKRDEVLREAERLVTRDRNDQYGPPEDLFSAIADIWTVLFGRQFTSYDVALAMCALKLVRLTANPSHADSAVDLAGYASIAGELGVGHA